MVGTPLGQFPTAGSGGPVTLNERLLRDITDFIFVSDAPRPADVILIPGCSFYQIVERAVPSNTQNVRREDWFLNESSFHKVLGELECCGKYFADSFDTFPSPR